MSRPLLERILARIRAEGPLTFAAYMEMALYDPDDGFFSRAPVGREFATAAHVSPAFAMLLARQVRDVQELIGRSPTVVDLGAGDGTLARRLRALCPDARIVAVERSDRARAGLADDGFETLPDVEALEPFTGIAIANELFDNLAFHLLRGTAAGTVEVFVDVEGERLIDREGPPTLEAPPLDPGDERPVSPGGAALARALVERIEAGYALVFDYGFVTGEPAEPIRGYRAHRAVTDLLAEPGETDITAPVDMDALAAAMASSGAQVWGPTTQREALLALGYREVLDELRAAQTQARAEERWADEIALFGARGDASTLVAPSGMGAFKVLAAGSPGLPPLRAVAY